MNRALQAAGSIVLFACTASCVPDAVLGTSSSSGHGGGGASAGAGGGNHGSGTQATTSSSGNQTSSSTGCTGGACTPCQLWAIHPPLAKVGESVRLEGTFTYPLDVTFGGVPTPSPGSGTTNRVSVDVPTGGMTGDLLVKCNQTNSASLPFRVTTMGVGLTTTFRGEYEQVDVARQMPTLMSRSDAASVVVGRYLFVMGGIDSAAGSPPGAAVDSVEWGFVNADGTVTGFSTHSAKLAKSVAGAATAVVPNPTNGGNHIYLFGGKTCPGGNCTLPAPDIQHIETTTDGSLSGSFSAAGSLTTPRTFARTLVIGSYLYVFGGVDTVTGAPIGTAERAQIQPDGTLGPFEDAGLPAPPSGCGLGPPALVDDKVFFFAPCAGKNTEILTSDVDQNGVLHGMTDVHLTASTWRDGTTVVLGTKIYLVGGSAGTPLVPGPSVQVFDAKAAPLTDPTPVATMITQRTGNLGAHIIGNNLYLVGGQVSDGPTATIEHATIDASSAVGSFGTATQGLQSARDGHSVVTLGDRVFVLGGGNSTTMPTTLETSIVGSDRKLGPFATGAAFPARRYHATVVLRGAVCVLGGIDGGGQVLKDVSCAPINADGTLGSFVQTTTLLHPNQGPMAFVVGSTLYVTDTDALGPIAALQQAPITNDSTSLSSTIGSFSSSSPSITLNTPRWRAATLVLNGGVCAIGGEDAAGNPTTSVECTGGLTPALAFGVSSFLFEGWGSANALVGGTFYTFGGMTKNANGTLQALTSSAQVPISMTDSYGSGGLSSSLGVANAAALVIDDTLYLLGGSPGVDGDGSQEILPAPLQ